MSGQKLLFIAHGGDIKDGGEKSFLELVKDARRRGYNVHAVLPANGNLAEQLHRFRIAYSVVPCTFWISELSGHSIINIKAVQVISRIIKDKRIECVITNSSVIPWGALAAALTNVPHAWIIREFPYNEFSYLAESSDFINAYSNLVIANSHKLASHLKNQLDISKAKYFHSYVDETKLRLNQSLTQTRLVCVGHLYQRKNQAELIKAVAILNGQGRSIDLLLIGDYRKNPAYYQQLKSLVNDLGQTRKVRFAGYLQKPFTLVGPNDIFVQCSLSESLGRSITEAMKLGLVCVGDDNEGNREAFSLGGGNLYPSGDVQFLADLLATIIDNFDKYKVKALASQQKAIKNLSRSSCHQPFFDNLVSIMGQPNPRAELRHIKLELDASVFVSQASDKLIAQQKRSIKQIDDHLNNIIQSKSWQLINKFKKLTRR